MTAAEIKALVAQGYCRVSRSGGLVSRIDRTDWKEHMARQHSPWSVKEGLAWVKCLGVHVEDQYRRLYSRDELHVGGSVMHFPPSDGTLIGYREKKVTA